MEIVEEEVEVVKEWEKGRGRSREGRRKRKRRSHPAAEGNLSRLDCQLLLWAGYGKFACAVTVISHNLTCIPPFAMVQSAGEKRGGARE